MPQIPDSHLLAARAVARVSSILAKAGALSEEIRNDYGEDLLVQTQLLGHADTFNIFIQVKGTRLTRNKRGKLTYRLSVGHLYRWSARLFPVLVCIYDDATRKVYAFDPAQRFLLWDLLTTKAKSKTIMLSQSDLLTPKTARNVIWECRIRHYSSLLALSENRQAYIDEESGQKAVARVVARETNLIVLNFLKALGVIEGDTVKESFRTLVLCGARHFSENYGRDDPCLREVVMFLLLGEAHDLYEGGLPANLMEHGTEMTGHFLRHWHQDEWSEAASHFDAAWKPYGND